MSRLEEYVDNLCDCFQQWKSDAYEHGDDAGVGTLDSCIEYARESMEDYAEDWILCSEKMPECDGAYLVTDVYGDVYCALFDNTLNYGRWTLGIFVAWMPLPEPCKEIKKNANN